MATIEKKEEVKVQGTVTEEVPNPPKPKMFKLTIHSEDSEEGRGDVPVGLNGHTYLIQRNKEVEVPEGVIEILKNTVVNTTGAGGEALRISRYNVTYSPV